MTAQGENTWKLALGLVVSLVFTGIGIGHILWPDYFTRRSGIRRGGEMLSEWNRSGVRLAALLFTILSVFMICAMVTALLEK